MMPCRKLKRESSIPASPSPSLQEDDIKDAPNSPKRGRKESEQKRRVLMNQYFDELLVLLMLLGQKHVPQKMDKVATLKETIACLKVYYQLTHLETPLAVLPKDKASKYIFNRGDALNLILNSQDSFLVLVSESGRVMFSNPLVTSLLGYMQTRLIGQNWYDFVHEKDKELFRSLFRPSANGHCLANSSVTVFPTVTCTLHIRLYSGEAGGQTQYLPFKCLVLHRECIVSSSELTQQEPFSPGEFDGNVTPLLDKQQHFVILIGKLPTSLLHVDLPVGTNDVNFDFELRVSKEGRIISIEEHAILIIGYNSSEIIGTSFFDYVDPYHLSDIAESISSLTKTGLGVTSPYRLMTKSGRYIWLISKAYTSYDPWINKPDHILFTNRVLGSDQVLPEHRFYRSRKLLPDPECEQEYVLPTCTHTPPLPRNSTVPDVQQNPLVEQYTSDAIGTMMGQGSSIVDTQLSIPSLSEEHARRMPALVQRGQQQQGTVPLQRGQQQQGTVSPLVQRGQQGTVPFAQEQPTLWKDPHQRHQEAPPSTSGRALPSLIPQELAEIQRELERKNREIFEMQQRMLEQQKLFEAERNQFYQVSQHVLNYITAGSQPNVPSDSKFLSSSEGTKKFGSVPRNFTSSGVNPSHGGSNTPQQHRIYSQRPDSLQYGSQSGPTTPVSTFSPYSPASQMYTSPSPALSTADTLDHGSSPSSLLRMYDSSDTNRPMYPPSTHYPPHTPDSIAYSTAPPQATLQEAGHFTDSLSMHNSMVCDAMGLANEHQILQQNISAPVVSQIQALSNMFGGH